MKRLLLCPAILLSVCLPLAAGGNHQREGRDGSLNTLSPNPISLGDLYFGFPDDSILAPGSNMLSMSF